MLFLDILFQEQSLGTIFRHSPQDHLVLYLDTCPKVIYWVLFLDILLQDQSLGTFFRHLPQDHLVLFLDTR